VSVSVKFGNWQITDWEELIKFWKWSGAYCGCHHTLSAGPVIELGYERLPLYLYNSEYSTNLLDLHDAHFSVLQNCAVYW